MQEQKIKQCSVCGKVLRTTAKLPFCSDECKEVYYIARERENNGGRGGINRAITDTTKMLICIYTAEGMSIKDIALFLNRPEAVITVILEACKKNGKYDFYVDNSLILRTKNKRH